MGDSLAQWENIQKINFFKSPDDNGKKSLLEAGWIFLSQSGIGKDGT